MKKVLQCLREIWFYLVLAILAYLLIPERGAGSFRIAEYTKRAIAIAQAEMEKMRNRIVLSREFTATPVHQDPRKRNQ